MAEPHAAGESRLLCAQVVADRFAIRRQLKANEQRGLEIIASLNNRSDSILEIEKEEGETTSQTAALVRLVSAWP